MWLRDWANSGSGDKTSVFIGIILHRDLGMMGWRFAAIDGVLLIVIIGDNGLKMH